MNKARRKQIEALLNEVISIKERLETVRDEEQEYFDNIPENLQQSETAEKSETAIDRLDDAVTSLEEVEEALNEAQE